MDGSIVETRVDWLTYTAGHDQKANDLLTAGLELVQKNAHNKALVSEWSFQGYRGITSPSVAAGWRSDGCCVRLGGAVAGAEWRHFCELAGRATRMDVAVTIRTDPTTSGLAVAAYRGGAAPAVRNGRQPERTLIVSTRGGETAYIGRRISDRFLRVYNKHVESRGQYPPGHWRYEIEYKHQLAELAKVVLLSAPDEGRKLVDMTTSEFLRAGVMVPWPVDGAPAGVLQAYREKPDIDRYTEWLRGSVRPAIEKLSTVMSAELLSTCLGVQLAHGPAQGDLEVPTKTRLYVHDPNSANH